MNSLNATPSRVLSAILLCVATSSTDARVGFYIAGLPQASQPQEQAPTQPAQADPKGPEVSESARSSIVSQKAIPLGGNTPDQQILPGTVTVSPDSSNVAYKLRYGNELGFDGYIYGGHKPIGTLKTTGPTFTPDSKSVAAVVIERGWKLRRGSVFLDGYEPVTAPRFSPDGERVIYLARMENQRFVVEGDQAHPLAESIAWDQLVFTPDSAVVAYPAFDGQHWRMVINGDPGPDWDGITTPPVVGRQGQRVLYVATKDGRYHVVDRHTPAADDAFGQSVAGFRLIDQPPVISSNGKAFAYWALGDDLIWRLYENHVHAPGYDADRPGQIVFSHDGQTLAAILKRGQHWHVVHNGTPSAPYAAIGKNSLVLSPDASRLVYAVKKPRGWAVVENQTEHPTYTTLGANSLRFSPDGERFVYVALKQGRWSVVLDGKAQQPFSKIATRSLTFSPDSEQLAYIGYNGWTAAVVRDGRVIGEYDHAEQPTFGPDGRHLVWLATDEDRSFLVADGTPSTETFDKPVPGSHIHFVNNLFCHTAVIRRPGPTFARIELKLSVPEEAPIPGNDGDYDPDTTPAPATPTEPESPLVEVPTD